MSTLLVACGALAREVIAIRDRRGWPAVVLALPAWLHNRPERIPQAVDERVEEQEKTFDRVIVVYGDCGTGGQLDRLLERRGWERTPGPHCYSLYAGDDQFQQLMDQETGTFFLTDFLTRSFDHLVLEGLGLDRHPELRDMYFGNYRRMVYLQQASDPGLAAKAEAAAASLDLPLETRTTGLSALERELAALMGDEAAGPEARISN